MTVNKIIFHNTALYKIILIHHMDNAYQPTEFLKERLDDTNYTDDIPAQDCWKEEKKPEKRKGWFLFLVYP